MKTFSDKTNDLDSLLNPKIFLKSKKKNLPDGFKKNKTVNEVLDKLTTFTLFDLIKSEIDQVISALFLFDLHL